MPAWILSLVVHYVLNQIAKLGTSVNWTKLATDTIAQVNALFADAPGWVQTLVLPGLDAVISSAVEAIATACTDTADLQLIVDDLQAQNWSKALTDLEALLGKVIHPSAGAVAAACVSCHTP